MSVNEHIWRHRGIANYRILTGFVNPTGDAESRIWARLLDLVPGHSGKAHSDWLQAQSEGFRPWISVATPLTRCAAIKLGVDEAVPT
ncbi:hypothetical protein J2S64_004064 [Paeniglutamicibacter sulfureus]|uniref:Uncharacterized protein n=1 Tax=Paeniglutamicibacter sulfureus TaxID=43666 RepID=A0ABU2BRK5_9MICC|nr:hypothetical protein [Paeniglutamicibacter sulfureus]